MQLSRLILMRVMMLVKGWGGGKHPRTRKEGKKEGSEEREKGK
jgi:hypothetical protein